LERPVVLDIEECEKEYPRAKEMAASHRRDFAKKLFELTALFPLGVFVLEPLSSTYQTYQAVGPGDGARFDKKSLLASAYILSSSRTSASRCYGSRWSSFRGGPALTVRLHKMGA
jgi:hypothetical protein